MSLAPPSPRSPAARRRLAAVVGLVWAAAAAGCVGWLWWGGRPERHLAEARRLLDAGAPAEAAGWLALPESTPRTRPDALLIRARAALERGRPAEAVAPLNGIDPDGPRGAEAAFWKGRTLQAAGRSAQAVAWFRRSLALRPGDAEAHRWLAAAAYDLGDRVAALDALRGATRLDPGDARSWRTLALLLKEGLDLEAADDAYRRAASLGPLEPRARMEWAEVLVGLGRYPDAERELASCRRRVPEPDRAALLAECLRLSGREGEARSLVSTALSEAPDHAGLNAAMAQLDLSAGRPADALARLDRALAADPHRDGWLYARGMALRRLGRDDEARRDLEAAEALKADLAEMSALNDEASLHPDDPEVRHRIGLICIRLGKPELAASWFRAALACDPGHAPSRAELLRTSPR